MALPVLKSSAAHVLLASFWPFWFQGTPIFSESLFFPIMSFLNLHSIRIHLPTNCTYIRQNCQNCIMSFWMSNGHTTQNAKDTWSPYYFFCPPHFSGIRHTSPGVPIMAQQKQILVVSMTMQVRSLASLRRLRMWCCHELWCRSQTWLGSRVAVAQASGCSSNLTPSLRTSICCRRGPKKRGKKKDTLAWQ